MGHPPERNRRSIRLKGHDYASPGAYFVTVCTNSRECTLDTPEFRDAAEEAWRRTSLHFASARTSSFVVMPNHVHGIVWILERGLVVGAQQAAPLHPPSTNARTPAVESGSLGAIVRSFKSATARRINEIRRTPGAKVWHRNYYERVIRNEDELGRVREYILLNPSRWGVDRENPQRPVSHEYEREWAWLEGKKRDSLSRSVVSP